MTLPFSPSSNPTFTTSFVTQEQLTVLLVQSIRWIGPFPQPPTQPIRRPRNPGSPQPGFRHWRAKLLAGVPITFGFRKIGTAAETGSWGCNAAKASNCTGEKSSYHTGHRSLCSSTARGSAIAALSRLSCEIKARGFSHLVRASTYSRRWRNCDGHGAFGGVFLCEKPGLARSEASRVSLSGDEC